MRKYSLPRHTILAKQSSRIGAFFIDLAITLAIFLGLYFGVGKPLFTNVIAKNNIQQIADFEYNSNLAYKDDNGNVKFYPTSADRMKEVSIEMNSEKLEGIVKYYYLNYLTGKDIKDGYVAAPNANEEQVFSNEEGPVLPEEHYTVRWFNETILGITSDDPDSDTSSCLFKWQLDGEGKPMKNEFGVARDKYFDTQQEKLVEVTETIKFNHFILKYKDAINMLYYSSFYTEVANPRDLAAALCLMIPVLLAGIVSYIVIPLFFKNAATVGKKIMKLGLASMQGYKYNKVQLLLRFVPFLLTCVACTFIMGTLYVVIIILVIMLLGSYGISIASPKKCSFHDYTGQSIVIDAEGSIIFDDFLEEEIYLNNEDGKEQEVIDLDNGEGGEEPELKYEK